MRVMCWNMAAGFGHAFHRHERAWRFVQAVDPDFALLQEAVVPTWAREHWGEDRLVFAPQSQLRDQHKTRNVLEYAVVGDKR